MDNLGERVYPVQVYLPQAEDVGSFRPEAIVRQSGNRGPDVDNQARVAGWGHGIRVPALVIFFGVVDDLSHGSELADLGCKRESGTRSQEPCTNLVVDAF